MDDGDVIELEIDRDAAARYLFWTRHWFLLLKWGMPFARRSAAALRYRIDGDTLRIDGGILLPVQRSIPLWKITTIAVTQTIIARLLGMKLVHCEPQGSVSLYNWYATQLIGLKNPEATRDLLLDHMRRAKQH